MWKGRPSAAVPVEVGERVAVAADLDDLVLPEFDRVAGELDEGCDVAAEEGLAVADPEHQRGIPPSRDDDVRLVDVDQHQRERAGQPPADRAHSVGERTAVTFEHAGDEVGDGLGVGVADELDAGGFEFGAQFGEVLDDPVVHDGDATARVRVRVRVAVVGRAVRRPPGVPHPGRPGDRPRRDLLVQVLDPPGPLGDLKLAGVGDDGDARGVVAAVLEAAQALDDDVETRPRTDVPDDAAHAVRVRERAGSGRGGRTRRCRCRSWCSATSSAGPTTGAVVVRVTGEVVTVTVGVTTTTDGVTVTVVVGAGTLLVGCTWSPNTVVPDPCVPRTTSVSGRPATSSTPVTTSSTPAKTPTHAAASTCHVPRLRASARRGSGGGFGHRRARRPASGDRHRDADPLAGAADRVAVHGIADDRQHARDGRADDRAGDAEVGRRDRRRRRCERARDHLRGGQRKTRRCRGASSVLSRLSCTGGGGAVVLGLITLSIVRSST